MCLSRLPNELRLRIAALLEIPELLQLRATCTDLQAVCAPGLCPHAIALQISTVHSSDKQPLQSTSNFNTSPIASFSGNASGTSVDHIPLIYAVLTFNERHRKAIRLRNVDHLLNTLRLMGSAVVDLVIDAGRDCRMMECNATTV